MAGSTGAVQDMTVDELMARHPQTMAVFNAFGIDSCCGAHSTVSEACRRDGVEEAPLVTALERVLEEAK